MNKLKGCDTKNDVPKKKHIFVNYLGCLHKRVP